MNILAIGFFLWGSAELRALLRVEHQPLGPDDII